MLEAAGVSPAWIYAYQHTGGLLPRPDGSFATSHDQAEWDETVARYLELHRPGGEVDHQAETRKLRNLLAGVALDLAASDPGYGAALAEQLMTGGDSPGGDAVLLREYLLAWENDLRADLRDDPAIADSAREYASAWAGADLADRVRAAVRAAAAVPVQADVLLAIAIATTRNRTA